MSNNINLLGEQFQEIMKQHSERMKRITEPLLNLQKLPVFEELQKNMQDLSRLTEGIALKNQESFEHIADLNDHSGLKALSEQVELMSRNLTANLSIDLVNPVLKDLKSSLNGLEISEDRFLSALEKLEKRNFVEKFENKVSNIEKGHSTAQGVRIGVSEVLAFLMFILMLIQTIDSSTEKELKKINEEQELTNQLLQSLVGNTEELINKSKDESLKLLIANEAAPLRTQPDIDSDTLITLFKGQHLDFLKTKDNWYKVQFYDFSASETGIGWVQKKYIIPEVEIGQAQTKKLGDIASSSKGKKPDLIKNESAKGLIPYVDIQGFEERIFRKYTDGKNCRLCEADDLLMVWDGSRSGLVGKAPAGAIGSTLAKIKIDGVINDYGYYFLQSHYQYLNTNPKGSGTPHVDPDLLWDLDIRVPPIEEQHRIVEKIEELFSDLDNGIKNLKIAKQQLETYKQSVLKAAFEGKLTEEWREQQNNLPSSEELKQEIEEERKKYREQQLKEWEQEVEKWKEEGEPGRKPWKPRKSKELDPIKKEELKQFDNIPISWGVEKLGNLFSVHVGSTPKRKEPKYWSGEINWVSSGEVGFTRIKDTEEKITKSGLKNSSTDVHPVGTIMLGMIGQGKTRGQAAILDIPAAHNQNTAAIRVPELEYSPELLYYYFYYTYQRTREIGSGNNQKALNKNRVRNITYLVIPPPEQKILVGKIESRLSIVEQVSKTIDQELQKAKALRQSILKKAFNGKLVEE